MDQDVVKRLGEALKYQNLAFRALLPESVSAHLDVIGKELMAMASDCAAGRAEKKAESSAQAKRNVKNVTIS